ncbi:unnamed protein product, partial [Porites evermanni]
APEDVTIHNYPAVPEFQEKEKVILVFPSEDAFSLKMIGQDLDQQAKELSDANKTALFERVVFIDSTWQQCHQIITDKKLDGLRRVKLENTCLATIEAIYYFFKEYEQHILKREYDGKFDNLLYFFAFQYNLIQEEQLKRQ